MQKVWSQSGRLVKRKIQKTTWKIGFLKPVPSRKIKKTTGENQFQDNNILLHLFLALPNCVQLYNSFIIINIVTWTSLAWSSHDQITIWLCFWFCLSQYLSQYLSQPKYQQILRRRCCLSSSAPWSSPAPPLCVHWPSLGLINYTGWGYLSAPHNHHHHRRDQKHNLLWNLIIQNQVLQWCQNYLIHM